jgi:hypothetical protein
VAAALRSLQREAHLDVDAHGHGLTVLDAGLELPLLTSPTFPASRTTADIVTLPWILASFAAWV